MPSSRMLISLMVNTKKRKPSISKSVKDARKHRAFAGPTEIFAKQRIASADVEKIEGASNVPASKGMNQSPAPIKAQP